ncbi:MAG: HutD family protein [Gammaproteobacteria bacterium]|nr:HutD family protein [Gammaproteobacteria bacterium]
MNGEPDLPRDLDRFARIEIVRRSEFRTTPWRNGGGVTHEAARRPTAGERFDWRVSVAEIATPGPFSAFEGYRRHMLLLQGAGVELDFPDGRRSRLARRGDLISYAGSPPPDCRLNAGPCVDLNLITAASIAVETWVLSGPNILVVPMAAYEVLLVFGLDAAGSIDTAGSIDALPAHCSTVGPTDLAIVDALCPGEIRVRAGPCAGDAPALFLAKLGPSEGG